MYVDGYETARRFAEDNLERIIKQMPPHLVAKEEKLFTKLCRHKESYYRKLERIYAFLDELNLLIGQYAPCHKGCSDCCHIEVSISSLEVKYIETKLGIVPTWTGNKKQFFGTPCPFLDNNSCLIYDYRPFVCRRHHALFDNPEWCQLDLCNKYEFPQIRCSEVEKSYNLIVKESSASLYDIRQVFIKP